MKRVPPPSLPPREEEINTVGSKSLPWERFREVLKAAIGLFFLYSFLLGCTKKPANIKVENKLDHNIVCLFSYDYPNLNMGLLNKITPFADKGRSMIKPNEVKEIDTLGLCDKGVWKKHIKSGVLIVFVEGQHWNEKDTTVKNAVERYYYTYEQLTKAGGVITIK